MLSPTLFRVLPLHRPKSGKQLLFGRYMVKAICSQDIFRGIAEFKHFTSGLSQQQASEVRVDMLTAVRDRVESKKKKFWQSESKANCQSSRVADPHSFHPDPDPAF
jgi:hypothetical protein